MKNLLIKTCMIIITALIFVACDKEDEETNFEVFADVYVIAKKINGQPGEAVAMYAMGNKRLNAAQVTTPGNGDNIIQLEPDETTPQNYIYDPEEQDFLSGQPVYGEYIFEVEGPGNERIEKNDFLQSVNLQIPEITDTSFNTNTRSLSVQWNVVPNADGLVLTLFNRRMESIYSSYIISPTATEYKITTGDGNWTTPAAPNDSLTLQVQAFKVETDAGMDNGLYNLEKISVGEADIIWGEE